MREGIFMQICYFSKIRSIIVEKYIFENIALFSFREWQARLSDIRIIIILLILGE